MPRTPAQNEAAREERQAAILQAALVVFARHGYGGSSIRDIATEAGIAQGLLYRYFASKEALLQAIMEQGMRDVLQSFAEAHAGASPESQLELLIRHSFALVGQHQDFWRLSYSVRMQPDVLDQLRDAFRVWREAILSTLEEHLQAVGYPHAVVEAALLFAQIDGVAQHYVMDMDGYPLEEVTEAIVRHYTKL